MMPRGYRPGGLVRGAAGAVLGWQVTSFRAGLPLWALFNAVPPDRKMLDRSRRVTLADVDRRHRQSKIDL